MFIYSVTVSYGGNNAFVLFLWNRITRGSGNFTMSFQSDPSTVQSLRQAGTNAGFTFSNISRVPVPPSPEVVP